MASSGPVRVIMLLALELQSWRHAFGPCLLFVMVRCQPGPAPIGPVGWGRRETPIRLPAAAGAHSRTVPASGALRIK